MRTEGMLFTVSRDITPVLIHRNIRRTVLRCIDRIPGCDKNMPGSVMAMGRLNRPAMVMEYNYPDTV